MNLAIQQPGTLDQFGELIRSTRTNHGQIVICGARSKITPVTEPSSPTTVLSTQKYSGIVDHQASDFTVTARCGTPVSDLVVTLRRSNQHLPFDPVFVSQGSTVGGLVASGINGPCRLRFGGLRDFVIGCQFVNDKGQSINAGGRVVKNAAGFDLPKFMIGSAGRFGVLTEITFKVFPIQRLFCTYIFDTRTIESAVQILSSLILLMEFDAIEITNSNQIVVRVSGQSDAIFEACSKVLKWELTCSFDVLSQNEEAQFWSEKTSFDSLQENDCLIKVPLTRSQIVDFDSALKSNLPMAKRRFSAAGNVGLVELDNITLNINAFDSMLRQLGLSGQIVVGYSNQFLLGRNPGLPFLKRIKRALDADNLFGSLQS